MKTEVRKEHGDWIVFVDDNPQFSFMYREEAEKVRNMVEELLAQRRTLFMQLSGLEWLENKGLDIGAYVENNMDVINSRLKCNEQALKEIGAI